MSKLNQIVLLIAILFVTGHDGYFSSFGEQVPHPSIKLFNPDSELDHIKEHMEVPQDTSNMAPKELQFHIFKMWDIDLNNKLDGCELVNMVIHKLGEGLAHDNSTDNNQLQILEDDELSNIVDPIIKDRDENQDGMIDYYEYMTSLDL